MCKYIEEKDYTIPVADLIVGAAANALNINLKIYENDKGVKKEIDFEPDNAQSSVMVHSLYLHNSNPAGDPNNLTSHYDALVLRNDAPISQPSNRGLESDMLIILLHDTTSDEDMYYIYSSTTLNLENVMSWTCHIHRNGCNPTLCYQWECNV